MSMSRSVPPSNQHQGSGYATTTMQHRGSSSNDTCPTGGKIVRDTVVEIPVPVVQERIMNVEEVEYLETIVEVPEKVIQEKIKHVPKIQYRERIVEVPKVIYKEKTVEVPEIEYREVLVEKIVEVPEVQEEIVIREVIVIKHVEKPVPEFVDVEVPNNIERTVPMPIETVKNYEFILPKLESVQKVIKVPIYAPRFIQVPIPAELFDTESLEMAEHLNNQLTTLAALQAPSLYEIERLAEISKNADFQSKISNTNLQAKISETFKTGGLDVSLESLTTTATGQ